MYFDDKDYLGKQIRKYRKNSGFTQEVLAEKVNLSVQHLSRIESGLYTPSLNTFFTLAKELKMDLKEFGFDINSTKNDLKDDLIQMISKASDVELIFYKNMLSAIKKSLEDVKKELL